MKRIATVIFRATLVSLGLLFVSLYFNEIWSHTSEAVQSATQWVSSHWLLLIGVATCLIGTLWIRLLDFWIWFRGIIGSAEKTFGTCSIIFATISILIGTLSVPFIGNFSGFLLIWLGVISWMLAPREAKEDPVDYYHRRHLVERLADLLIQTPHQIRRIGILAEWGEGKTQVMKLLENDLQRRSEAKFRMAWVNPWRSGSGEEAWVEIARGVDRALGFARLLPHSLFSIPVIGTALELLPKPFSGFTSDLKTLLTSNGTAAEKIAIGLSEFLRRRNQWLLIFIDDMERVSAEELKKIFPVVDRLVELERCYFIIALDPKRIAKAFEEDTAHGEETKGYLDKVLDFQMSLPSASKGEVFEMLQNGIDQDACPKLYEALPRLRDYLPVNPRLADRFLRDADGKERMFLSRFGANEENYEGFFLLQIFEICFPGAFQRFRTNLPNFDGIDFLARKGYFGSDHEEDEKYNQFIKQVVIDMPTHEADAVKKLVKQITHLSTHLLIFDEGVTSLDLKWALDGYRKLIRFSVADRIQFLEIWRKRAGKEPLASMLRRVNEYDEPDLVVRQALKMELEGIGNGFNHAYRIHRAKEELEPLRLELESRSKNFIAHASAIFCGKMESMDRLTFNEEIFDVWIEISQNKLLVSLPDEFVSILIPIRQQLTKSLARLLSPEKYLFWAWHTVPTIFGFAQGGARQALEDEFLPIRAEILDELTEEFLHLLETNRLTDEILPTWMKGLRLFDLNDPTKWLLNATEEQPSLDSRVQEASNNLILRENFALLINKAILEIYSDNPDEITLAHSNVRPSIKKYPWLLQKCWRAAFSGSLSNKTTDRMLELRDKAISVESSLIEHRDPDPIILEVLRNLDTDPHPSEFSEDITR